MFTSLRQFDQPGEFPERNPVTAVADAGGTYDYLGGISDRQCREPFRSDLAPPGWCGN